MKKCLLGATLVFGLSLAPLRAQMPLPKYENNWELSAFTGFSHLGKGSFVTPIEGGGEQTVGLDPENGITGGVRITENRWEHFAAEFEYAYSNHPFRFLDLKPTLSQFRVKQKIHKLAYSMLFYPDDREARIRPFGSVGVGTSFYHVSPASKEQAAPEGINLKSRWKIAFTYGAGVKFMVGKNWGIRGGFRDHVTSVPDYGLPSVVPQFQGNTGVGFRPTGLFHNWQITIGLIYTFDRI